jgi:hypothetical protein
LSPVSSLTFERRPEKMTRGQISSVALISVLLNLILFSSVHGSLSQSSFAALQEEGLRTLEIEVNLDSSVVGHGEKQTIHFQVTDQKSDKPISKAITSATISYADGKTIRHFSVFTDESGRSAISWTIEDDAPIGVYEVVYSVHQRGYESESFGGSFTVVTQNVATGCLSSSFPPSMAAATAGPSTSIAGGQTSQTC